MREMNTNLKTTDSKEPLHQASNRETELYTRAERARRYLLRGPKTAKHLRCSTASYFREGVQCLGFVLHEYAMIAEAHCVCFAYRVRPVLNCIFRFRFPFEPSVDSKEDFSQS